MKAQWKNGITVFNNPKRSKVNEAFFIVKQAIIVKVQQLKLCTVEMLSIKILCWPFTFWDFQKCLSPFSTGPFKFNVSWKLLAAIAVKQFHQRCVVLALLWKLLSYMLGFCTKKKYSVFVGFITQLCSPSNVCVCVWSVDTHCVHT